MTLPEGNESDRQGSKTVLDGAFSNKVVQAVQPFFSEPPNKKEIKAIFSCSVESLEALQCFELQSGGAVTFARSVSVSYTRVCPHSIRALGSR